MAAFHHLVRARPLAATAIAMRRVVRFTRGLFAGAGPAAASPELWCRPATVVALRDRARATSCLAGWH